ncbi:MAG: citramalate synthase [Planctomycetes bacterium]|nr:citramalate synthase [Planctomycetota bacterium]
MDILTYDATLRDGAQAEGVFLSTEDKIAIALKLDEFGIDYVEGGFPESNPTDIAFFKAIRMHTLRHARLAAFGATRRKKMKVENDPGIAALLAAGAPVVTIVGKSWDLHVRDVLKTPLDENLRMIEDTVRYLRRKRKEVVFDAEHFFDGFKADPDYALRCAVAAAEAGAQTVVLCDTNGGSLPEDVQRAAAEVRKVLDIPLGIHTHNDANLAVATTLAAVSAGATHVQGTVNGIGERCGNVDLCSVIPNLALKRNLKCTAARKLDELTDLSRFVSEVCNIVPRMHQPFVGLSAFAHKGGQHIDAILKNPRTYEHVPPESVGNERRLLLSDLAGRSTVVEKVKKFGLKRKGDVTNRILRKVQEREHEGYEFEAAEGSFELMVRKEIGRHRGFFDLEGFRVIIEKRENGQPVTEATVKIRVGNEVKLTVSEGDGPVNALDGALRNALREFYPAIREVRLVDFKVRVINPRAATAARVCVVIQSRDRKDVWGTVGVSENIIEASWQALVDSVEYKLLKDGTRSKR